MAMAVSTQLILLLISSVMICCINSQYVDRNVTTKDAITASLAQSLHGIADALLANSQQSSLQFCLPFPATACDDIKKKWPNSTSGYYTIGEQRAYCHMEELCSVGGGWTRLAYLNMNESVESCPSGFQLYQSRGVRACGRAASGGGSCTSVKFPSNDISYSQVCGRVVGYHWGAPDAVSTQFSGHYDINSHYVDGVSITHGYPRQHVWTLMAGINQAGPTSWPGDARYNCPCSPGSPQNSTLQAFIGNDYFCESGNPRMDGTYEFNILYTSDPLWDGKGCGPLEGDCCTAHGLPWFHKVLKNTTTDCLELRVCGDQGDKDEDTPVSFFELYVK